MKKKSELVPDNIIFDSHIESLEYLLGVNYIFVPAAVVEKAGGLKSGRWICKLKNHVEFQCGFMSLSEGNAYITLNKARMKKLGLKTGDSIHVELVKDKSEFGMDIPEELSELLIQDEVGNNRFRALKPGMQRYIIFYVAQVKNPQLRIDRSLMLINNLKKQEIGKESFRAMLGKD